MKRDIQLLLIDPQNDFCDLPTEWQPVDPLKIGTPDEGAKIGPALAVAGAHQDMLRVADLINKAGHGLSDISVTLDSHHYVGIERPTFWRKADGSPVTPFTEITAQSVRAGQFMPRNPGAITRVLAYLDALEASGRYKLMVWTIHCEIGTWGHGVHNAVRAAYNRWEEREQAVVNKVTKGSNPWTEHYSAVKAEVPDANDPSTQINRGLIDILAASDLLVVAGEAGSHCVPSTTYDIADQFGDANLHKMVLLSDCMSPVTGFEAQFEDFLKNMQGRGATVTTSVDFLPELLANARR